MAININLRNTDVDDLFVSVFDLNRSGKPKILSDQRINRDQSFPISIQEDGDESGSIRWNAVRADDDSKKAERGEQPRDGDVVDVTTRFG